MPAIIRIILGSVRAGRLCPIVAEWVAGLGRGEATGLDCTLIDLKDRHLPMNDEPNIPSQCHGYEQPHTKIWSEEVKETSAFVVVTPQYNGGIPRPPKERDGSPVPGMGGQAGAECDLRHSRGHEMRRATAAADGRPEDASHKFYARAQLAQSGNRGGGAARTGRRLRRLCGHGAEGVLSNSRR